MLLGGILAFMTLVALALVIAPLVKSVPPLPERARFERAVYRDQLRELERDLARGLIARGESATVRIEIERRLLTTGSALAGASPSIKGSLRLAILLALLAAGGAGALYIEGGAPGVPDQPYAERAMERALNAQAGRPDLDKAEAELAEKLKTDPQDADSWLLYASTEAALGQWQKSAEAFRRAMALTNSRPDVAAAFGEMLVQAADGIVAPPAREMFTTALAHDPQNAAARYYLGLGKAQQGDVMAGIADWQKLAAEQPAGSALRRQLDQRIVDIAASAGLPLEAPAAEATPLPDEAALAAAAQMEPGQRQAVIGTMAERLAGELPSHPDDLASWLRLARAYGVLGETDKAADAYEHAAALKPDDGSIPLDEAEMLLAGRSVVQPMPERALEALRRAQALRPDDPTVLWYVGLAAAKDRDFATARTQWQKLLAALPADSSEREMVTAALRALDSK